MARPALPALVVLPDPAIGIISRSKAGHNADHWAGEIKMYYADYRRRLRREEVSYPLGWARWCFVLVV